ncbi:3-hydroxyacyl-CoA dehydrogenase NAD-binding domain-containing protein [Rhodococcus rhodochrous]|uniref:3-hydroxyacyl-CoA dehydrogenase NAD-binding domain-containing protein n=1 Tax=Rhodococcus rhodochrous TaxID=1829 RepID=UPI001E456704|nr:3-hydroxyacyl-CoA dehydrogenase NAD-binding domain-containing protein [Rhodococcus rhodochrous]MCD2100331.1 3-hydroxyacyl-CoA dehydrogenase NAD-binding domain-containing protein [Rhodococcus rhodochrous]MCD2124674.1 3-hydroxyacyl-CoA dehydrogenase NAD-binding domain-containing protein [Rhodococcus rhodochrous]MCQ4137989.1 3-hydroxyacyl-CoA dehydrogenase NAD-binding domain-containing protein [Rhodococcus rhodochrous]MDJ0021543.1 3-hydroxyacyl-CoA dehydrogenase NAD-binding domain-containing pr
MTIERHDHIAVVSIDHPPVNAGTAKQRGALLDAITTVGAWPDLSGVVVTTAGKHFYAGSDLKEFDGPLAEPQLPSVIAAVEALDVPVVAALRGLALGGGLEFALGCDARVATPEVQLGFPEVGFGIVPGAGGTVRSARLIGVEAAFDLVTTGRRVTASEACSLGLVDEIVAESALLERAITLAGSLGEKRRLVEIGAETPFPGRDELLGRLPRRHRPNVRLGGELVISGIALSASEALTAERERFDELRVSDESNSLRYLFFARQSAAKALRSRAATTPIKRVGVIGAGTMGAGLAQLFADKGYETVVVDGHPDALARITDDAILTSTALDVCADCDLVIEAVYEDMQVKHDLLRELEGLVRPDAILATNTSYLDINEMATALSDPSRFGGLHFFNPPQRNKLVEVIPGAATSEQTRAALGELATALGKIAVPSGIGDGFIGNRVYADYRTQAEFLVEDGASPAEVDRAMELFGMAMGPFSVADMSGLDIAWSRRKRLASSRDPRLRYVSIADRLCETGRLGKKAGAGWYAYPEGARRGVEDPTVVDLIDRCRAEAGVTPRSIDVSEIQRRLHGAMVAGAAAVLDSGVAERTGDIDLALTEGFAFPRHLGGPVKAFSRMTEDDQLSALAAVYCSDPIAYTALADSSRGEMPPLVQRLLNGLAK